MINSTKSNCGFLVLSLTGIPIFEKLLPSFYKLLKVSILTLLFVNSSFAQMQQNATIGNAKADALGHAVTADPVGIDSIHFNPAGLTRLPEGRSVDFKLTGIHFKLHGQFTEPKENPFENLFVVNLNGDDCWDDCLLANDPIANQTTTTVGSAAVLPQFGMVDLPTTFFAPTAGFAFRPSDSKFTFATAFYTPMAIGMRRPDNDPAIFQGRNFSMSRFNYFTPTLAYQLNDAWSLGFALTCSYMGLGVDFDLRFKHVSMGLMEQFLNDESIAELLGVEATVSPLESLLRMDLLLEDRFTPGFNVGLLWEPNDWFAWGMVYQSEVKDHLKGEVTVSYSDTWSTLWSSISGSSVLNPLLGLLDNAAGISLPDGSISEEVVGAEMEFVFPRHASTGVSLRFLPRWKLNIDFKFYGSKVWDYWTIRFTSKNDLVGMLRMLGVTSSDTFPLPRGYQNVTSWAFGLEHIYNDRLTVRVGYEPRGTAIPQDKLDLMAPISNLDMYSVGGEWRFRNKSTLDFSLSYLATEDFIPANGSTNINSVDPINLIYNPYAGLDVTSSVKVVIFNLNYHRRF